jgi:hypothetical protein
LKKGFFRNFGLVMAAGDLKDTFPAELESVRFG